MRFIDFFAGIGGFRVAMERAGHVCAGHCEIDKYADASYRAMHIVTDEELDFVSAQKNPVEEIRKEKYLHGEWYANDITRVEPGDLPDADCYCFGFPCQAFSIAGLRRGFDDTRGTLFFEVMRLAKERKPPLLFAENVAGLLNHEEGITFGVIVSAMAELGYRVEWQVFDSQYWIPQHRERVFIVGHLGERSGRAVFPITENSGTSIELQGYGDSDRVINNTLSAGDREGKWIPQEGHITKGILRPIEIAHTLDTKCGSLPGFWANYVKENDKRSK